MKKIFAFIVLSVCIIYQLNAQNENFKLTGDARTGSGFAPLFGLKTSEQWSAFYMVDLQSKSGFGIGAYRITDFQKEGLGRIGFFDLYWSKTTSKNTSVYSAIEYGFFDNNKKLSFWCPYIIFNWNNSFSKIDFSPMYCYYDKTKSDQFVFRLRTVKEIYKGGTLRISGWYNNLLVHKFYGAVGFTQQLPKNFYLQGDILLFREKKTQPMLSLGYKF